jgi:phosphohistidine phosphatase
MKFITLLRHGNAESANLKGDFSRKLTEHGMDEAKIMGDFIKTKLPKVDSIICSSALRAAETAHIIAEQLGFPKKNIKETDDLYSCNSSVYFDMMTELPPTVHHVVFVGHNPEISMMLNTLLDDDGEDLVCCELAHVSVDTFKWEDVDLGTGVLLENEKPEDL